MNENNATAMIKFIDRGEKLGGELIFFFEV